MGYGRPPKLTMEQSEAIESRDCETCGKPASESVNGRHGCVASYEDGRGWQFRSECVACWNASVERDRAQRKAELAARPDCEACHKRKVGYTLRPNARVSLEVCRACAKRAQHNLRQPMIFATGWGHVTRESLIAACLNGQAPARRAS